MAQEEKSSPVRIFVDGKPVAMATDCKIEISEEGMPPQEERQVPMSFETTATIDVSDEGNADALRRIKESLTISRRERKQMFHAVTHGQGIVMVGRVAIDGGNFREVPVVIDRPSVLRRFIANVCHGSRFRYAVVPLNLCEYSPRLDL